jgi:ethanolamine utilization protein EutN
MQPATVLGTTRATVKHESFDGHRLVIVQPLLINDGPDGAPLIAIDGFGARKGDRVMLTSDGSYAREITDNNSTPARWSVAGILD